MAPTDRSRPGLTVLIGGVAQLYQGDLDFGRVALERLTEEDLERHLVVEELGYGAVAVAQRLEELRPAALVLIGAASRGRAAGTVERRRIHPPALSAEQVRQAVAEAVTGYVTIDLLIEVCAGLGALPARTVTIELEPARAEVSERLSSQASAALAPAVRLLQAEVRRIPLLSLADRVRAELNQRGLEPTPAVQAVGRLLRELAMVDEEGRWGDTFLLRDVLRSRIGAGETACDMSHLDWGLWWGLVEELDRLQPLEGVAPSRSPSGSSSRMPRF